jgi:hypothetical protein
MRSLNVKILFVAALAFLGLMAVTSCFPAVEASEMRNATFPLSGRLSLIVDGTNGNVTVHGQEGLQEVRVTATLHSWGMSQAEADKNLTAINVQMSQQGNEVHLRHIARTQVGFGFFKSDQVSFEVWIPSTADLSLTTENGNIVAEIVNGDTVVAGTENGNISLSAVNGALKLTTENGNIRVEKTTASITAATENGNIRFSGHLIGTQHSARTDNGNIDFMIPADSSLHIDARVNNGSIHSDLPVNGEMKNRHWDVTLNDSQAMLTATTDNGGISFEELSN